MTPSQLADEIEREGIERVVYNKDLTTMRRINETLLAALRAQRAEELPKTQHRYSAPFKMYGKTTEWVQTRFVPREHIHDKPTEANPSPIRVILLGDLERAQPDAMAFNDSLGGPAPR